jgi:hypothetical protein
MASVVATFMTMAVSGALRVDIEFLLRTSMISQTV